MLGKPQEQLPLDATYIPLSGFRYCVPSELVQATRDTWRRAAEHIVEEYQPLEDVYKFTRMLPIPMFRPVETAQSCTRLEELIPTQSVYSNTDAAFHVVTYIGEHDEEREGWPCSAFFQIATQNEKVLFHGFNFSPIATCIARVAKECSNTVQLSVLKGGRDEYVLLKTSLVIENILELTHQQIVDSVCISSKFEWMDLGSTCAPVKGKGSMDWNFGSEMRQMTAVFHEHPFVERWRKERFVNKSMFNEYRRYLQGLEDHDE